MYMNAITVNYAEVGDDHLPISFGFGSKTSFAGETVYNSTITEIPDTSCIILQGRDIGTQKIIVYSDLGANRLLSSFKSGSTSWIEHIIPNINDKDKDTTYIFYNSSEGYYYKMVENDQGKPVQEKYAPYAYLKAVQNNVKYPYCEATIETPVELQISDGKVNAIINNKSVQIAKMESSLVVELENADGTYGTQTITENEYSINTSMYNLDGINWTRNNNTVTSWLLDNNKIVKSLMSISSDGWTKTIKLLAGNNVVTIPRNKSTITVNFTFTNTAMSSFEWGGAYHNGFESSTMSSNTLTIKNVRQGSSKNLTTFFTGSEAIWFNPSTIGPLPGQGTFSVEVNIPTPSVSDTIKFTGWIDGKLEQEKSIPDNKHGILPETYTINKMNTENLSSVDITNESPTAISGLLTYDQTSKQFKRHRQITQITKSSTSTRTTTIDDSRNPGTTSTDIYIYASNNNMPQIFNVTAKYNGIPYIVDGNNNTKGTTNQVVSFKNTNYVYNDGMKQLVKNLTNINVTSLNGSKNVTYYNPSIPVNVQFPDITFSITIPSENGGETAKETSSEGEVPPSSSNGTTEEEYTATINCTVKDFIVTEHSYTINKNNTHINASLIYNIKCEPNSNKTSFTCTVNITKITIQDKDYTISNATTSQTGNVQTVTKQLFS